MVGDMLFTASPWLTVTPLFFGRLYQPMIKFVAAHDTEDGITKERDGLIPVGKAGLLSPRKRAHPSVQVPGGPECVGRDE